MAPQPRESRERRREGERGKAQVACSPTRLGERNPRKHAHEFSCIPFRDHRLFPLHCRELGGPFESCTARFALGDVVAAVVERAQSAGDKKRTMPKI